MLAANFVKDILKNRSTVRVVCCRYHWTYRNLIL